MVSEPEDYADFRILAARYPSGSKKNSMSFDSTNGMTRYRFTLGEVLSWNIDIDVIVGNGWTRITLREIPRFLVDALDFITANGLQIDGIFRKEGNSARLNRQEVLEVYLGVRQIPSDFTVLDVCTMVKRFLKDLKPTLLNSEEVRLNIIRKAKKARLSGEFELSHLEMVEIFESAGRHLSPAHLGTLGYVMRLLSRIAKHWETHKMTADNLAVVLVGSVFGDFMAGGGTESRKKMQQARKCTEAELHAKKEDMGIQVAAVKLLIVNANLIGLPHGHYVSSNRLHLNSHMNIRSTSAMPNIRCSSLSENEQSGPTSSATTPRVFSMAKASLMHQNHPASTGSSQIPQRTTLTRRDSDLTHVKGVNKPSSSTGTKRRRTSRANSGMYQLNNGFEIPISGFPVYTVSGDDVMTAIDAALTAGYRMFDTAKYYNNEKDLGEAIKVLLPKHGLARSDIFITTKFFPERDDCRKACEYFVEESLKNLNTNYIDMYLVHHDNDDEKNVEYRKIAYQVLEKAQADGKITSLGVSNYGIKHLEELRTYSKVPPCVNEIECQPRFRYKDLSDYCMRNNIIFKRKTLMDFSGGGTSSYVCGAKNKVAQILDVEEVETVGNLLSRKTTTGTGERFIFDGERVGGARDDVEEQEEVVGEDVFRGQEEEPEVFHFDNEEYVGDAVAGEGDGNIGNQLGEEMDWDLEKWIGQDFHY